MRQEARGIQTTNPKPSYAPFVRVVSVEPERVARPCAVLFQPRTNPFNRTLPAYEPSLSESRESHPLASAP
eukprot:scaffold239585_cov19-Tisochrysis_lutea.AAC.1